MPHHLYVLVVESDTTVPARHQACRAVRTTGGHHMFARLGPAQPAQGADVIARAVGALALAALAVIHVVDLPGTLGPTPLVGAGYFAIIAAAVVTGGVMITRSHWLAWAAAGGVAALAMGGYVLTRAVPGGFLGDHSDVGNWN